MKVLCIALFFILPWQCNGNRCGSTKPLGVTVLYESLCPDSQQFFKSLWPVYKEYHKCINLTLVPHGKSTPTESGFMCQHGRQECWGNRMQNCALHSNLNQLNKFKFVTCEMQNLKLVRNNNFKCAKIFRIINSVKNCMRMHSHEYQREAAIITDRFDFSEIPAIIFNGVFNESIQRAAQSNVYQTLCNILRETKHLLPDEC